MPTTARCLIASVRRRTDAPLLHLPQAFFASLVLSTAAVGVSGPLFIPAFGSLSVELGVSIGKISQLNGILVMFIVRPFAAARWLCARLTPDSLASSSPTGRDLLPRHRRLRHHRQAAHLPLDLGLLHGGVCLGCDRFVPPLPFFALRRHLG